MIKDPKEVAGLREHMENREKQAHRELKVLLGRQVQEGHQESQVHLVLLDHQVLLEEKEQRVSEEEMQGRARLVNQDVRVLMVLLA